MTFEDINRGTVNVIDIFVMLLAHNMKTCVCIRKIFLEISFISNHSHHHILRIG